MSWFQSLVWMLFIKMEFSFICFRVEKQVFSSMVKEQYFTTSRVTTIHQGWSFRVFSRVHVWNGRIPNALSSTHSQRIRSESCLCVSAEEDDVSLLRKGSTFIDSLLFCTWCSECQRSKGQQHYHKGRSQKVQSVIQLDLSFYKIPGENENLKVLTCVETVTSISGAVIVPHLSVNQVAVKALKQFIAVNGFTKSVLPCDGRSGLLNLQEQAARDLSLSTQVSPPYPHQSQGAVERSHNNTLHGQVRAIRIGPADHLGVHSDQVEGSFVPWIIQLVVYQMNKYLVRSDGQTSYEKMFKETSQATHCPFWRACSCSHSVTTTSQKLYIRASPRKSDALWLGKDVITGMHIVSAQESCVDYQEMSCERMLFLDLVQKFLLQQKNQVKFVISLEKVGTHHNPWDGLTKFAQAAVLGQHLP